jgi:RHS repeat-associated protein
MLGKVTARTDPLGRATRYRYDAKGRLIQVSLPSDAVLKYAYDADDNVVQFVDANGAVTRLDYCGLGEVKHRIQPDGAVVTYDYDAEERLIAVTNQRGETFRLRRDALGRVVEEIDYWGQPRAYAYDAAGHIRRCTDPLGRAIHYTTDPIGRVRRKVLPLEGQPHATFEERFDFDANGNLVRIANPHVTVTRRFDAEGRLLEEARGSFTVKNSYDANGNRVRRETSAGNSVTFAYDPLDRVSAIRINDDPPLRIERDGAGQIVRETLGHALIRHYGYDAMGRQCEQTLACNGQALSAVRFAYDPAGNLVERIDSEHGIDRFRYDPLGRILDHTDPQRRLARFLYDPVGGLLATRVGQAAAQPDIAPERHAWAREGDLSGVRYRFDQAGNLVDCGEAAGLEPPQSDARTSAFAWDANQRLLRSEVHGIVTRYGYDALGRRVFKETNGTQTNFYWDGDALVAEDVQDTAGDGSGQLGTREYLYYPGTFEPLALIEGTGEHRRVWLYQTDPSGCPTRLVGEDGKAVWSASYDAWGTVAILHVGGVSNPIRLQGQYEDAETGFHYNRYRYYCGTIGQFASQDPLRLQPSDNIYEFAPNVFAWADPLGLARQPGHRTPFSWSRPSTGEWEIGDEFSGLGPGTPKRRLDPQDRLVTHTESWILMRLEDHVQAGDVITILGTRDPCTPANGCYNKMRDFAQDHHVEIIYVNTTRPGREWRFKPKGGCAR